MTTLHNLTVVEAAGLISTKRLSPVELMEALLALSERVEPDLNIWVTLDPDGAMAAAKQSEEELARSGPSGLLHGVPVGVKDIFYTAGIKTTAGSPIYAEFVPDYDATSVSRLKHAGAIVMGKTVTTEFACLDPSPTRNAWNMAHTPGGSSSGSAAGVAARVFPTALGSQTGGSVLRPASYNGVVGLKPTFGRISRYGVVPVAESLDTVGHFARSVEDVALMLQVMAGHDASDLDSSNEAVPDYVNAPGKSSPWRVGLLRQHFFEKADHETLEHTEKVIRSLAEEGADIEDMSVPMDIDDVVDAHGVVMAVEAAEVHEKDYGHRPEDYGPKVGALIEKGLNADGLTYLRAKQVQRRFRRAIRTAIDGFDVIVTPSTYGPAPKDLTTTGDPMFQSPWTFSGLPTITLPSGLSESGMPLGIQLAAGAFDETTLLAAAAWCEQVLKFDLAPAIAT